jgi:hypothetical protein
VYAGKYYHLSPPSPGEGGISCLYWGEKMKKEMRGREIKGNLEEH